MRQDDGKGSARAGALAAGTSYPPSGIAVDIAADAPASITDVASVSGGGRPFAAPSLSSRAGRAARGPATKRVEWRQRAGDDDVERRVAALRIGSSPRVPKPV